MAATGHAKLAEVPAVTTLFQQLGQFRGGVPVAGVGPGAQDLLAPIQVASHAQQPV